MHPKYIQVLSLYNNGIFSHVEIRVIRTGKEHRLYDEQAKRFMSHYKWSETQASS